MDKHGEMGKLRRNGHSLAYGRSTNKPIALSKITMLQDLPKERMTNLALMKKFQVKPEIMLFEHLLQL